MAPFQLFQIQLFQFRFLLFLHPVGRQQQVLGTQHQIIAQNSGALHDMLQLAHIARPVVLHQFAFGFPAQSRNVLFIFPVIQFQKVHGQQDDVLTTLT